MYFFVLKMFVYSTYLFVCSMLDALAGTPSAGAPVVKG